MADTWEDVANALAARLMHARYPDHQPLREDCPFCEDNRAWQRYVAKRSKASRPELRDPFAGTKSVLLADLHKEDS